jgi:hypothetical protein
MTKKETMQIIWILQVNYPDSFRYMSDQMLHAVVDLWQDMFREEPAELVREAVKAYMASSTEKYMPNVGQIREQLRKLTQKPAMTWQEAWDMIYRAICNSSYNAEAEFQKLPETLQRCVGSPNMLRDYALMDVDTVQSVVSSNLQKSYNITVKRDEEYARLPAGTRERLQTLTGVVFRPMLEEGQDDA